MNEYKLIEEIGRDALGCVYKARKYQTLDFYAIHSIDKSMRQRVLNNVRVLKVLHHPNVIRLHGWHETANHFWVIKDLCISGNLQSILQPNCPMKRESVRLLGSDVCAGLFYTHTKGLLHRNLKPSSLFMNATASLVLSDFDLACPVQEAGNCPLIGTPPYIAPELLMFSAENAPSIASDLWSLGCVLYEMASGEPPFKGKDLKELLTNVFTKPVNPIEGLDEDFNGLIIHLLEKNPIRRATWKNVLSCKFWGCALEGLSFDMLLECSWMKSSIEDLEAKEEMPWSEAIVRAAVRRVVKATSGNCCSTSSSTRGGVDSPRDWVCTAKELNFSPDMSKGAEVLVSHRVCSAGESQKEKAHSTVFGTRQSAASCDLVNSNYHPPNIIQSISDARLTIYRADYSASCSQRRTDGAYGTFKSSDFLIHTPLDEQSSGVIRCIPILDLIWCASDANVRPLWRNRNIGHTREITFKTSRIPFQVYELDTLAKLSEHDFESFMKCIYTSLSCQHGTDEQKDDILKYLERIINGPVLSNRFANSSIMVLCVKMAGSQHLSLSCRVQAASLSGQLVRHASYISSDLIKTSILPQLLLCFPTEPNLIVKCKLVMCIGELIYYVAAQKGHVCAEWEEVEEDVRAVFTLALETEDPLILHSAVKAIENLSANSEKCTLFCSKSIIERLLAVYALDSSHSRRMRTSALSAASRLATLKDELIPALLADQNLRIDTTYAELVEHSPTPRCVQVLLSFINHIFLKAMVSLGNPFALVWTTLARSSGAAVPLTFSLSRENAEDIINIVMKVKDNTICRLCNDPRRVSATIAAKVVLFMLLLGCFSGRVFSETCTLHQLEFIANFIGEKDCYFQRCVSAFLTFLSIYVSTKLSSIARCVSPTTTPLYITSMQNIFSSIILLKSIPLRLDAFESLRKCLKEAVGNPLYSPYEENFDALALDLVRQAETIVEHREAIFSTLVPHYIEAFKKGARERRLVALYFLASSISNFEAPHGMDTIVEKWVRRILLNLMDVLAELLLEVDPIPRCALRLLYTCVECHAFYSPSFAWNRFCSCLWNYLSCVDDVDLFYPLYLLHAVYAHNIREAGEQAEIRLALKQNDLDVLNRISVFSMENGFLHISHICCKLIDAILCLVKRDAVFYTDLECSVFTNSDAVESVFLPLCLEYSISMHAAAIICNLTHLCPSARRVLRSVSGQNVLRKVLSMQPINTEAVEFLLRAFLYASEKEEGGSGIRHFANDEILLRVLKKATGGDTPTALSLYAAQLYRVITDQQVLCLS